MTGNGEPTSRWASAKPRRQPGVSLPANRRRERFEWLEAEPIPACGTEALLDLAFDIVDLEDSEEWRILPSLEMLRSLKRLKLSNMQRVREISVPSLEELVLYEMTHLQRCYCTSMGDMKSSLRVLEIQSCPALEVFDLFQKDHNYEMEHKPWLPSLRKLMMCNCPLLQVQMPLPPSTIFSELLIRGVSTIVKMWGSSMGTFKIEREPFGEMMPLDEKKLAFHNLKDIKYLGISRCTNLTSISFKGLSQLISLKSLRILSCKELFSSDDVPEQTQEDIVTANDAALPALESLDIIGCGIMGKWLSLMLRHSPTLKELNLDACPQLKQLKKEEALSSGYVDDARLSSVVDGIVHIPLNLRKITIRLCPHLIFDGSRKGFAGFTSLENKRCFHPQPLQQLVWFDYSRETLRPCFVCNRTCLKKLQLECGSLNYLQLDSCTALEDLEIHSCNQLVTLEGMRSLGRTLRSLKLSYNSRLKSLQLNSCTALEHLEIHRCSSLVTLEGLQSLVYLKYLKILKFPALDSLATSESYEPIEEIPRHSYELFFPTLESLVTNDSSHLKTSFCMGLTCLRSLKLVRLLDATRLTDDQESALLLLMSLQKLCLYYLEHLVDLPVGLRGLPSLKTLKIKSCKCISGLPKEGLPPSQEELVVDTCSFKLSEQCRLVATSKLEVKINGDYVD